MIKNIFKAISILLIASQAQAIVPVDNLAVEQDLILTAGTANKVLYIDADKKVQSSPISNTDLVNKQAGPLTGDVTTSGTTATLSTVNSNVGSFTSANITVDAKGRITAAANGAGGGVSSVNSLTGDLTLTSGTAGSDFAVNSSGVTLTLDLPTASSIKRGALSSSDWSFFDGKQDALSFGDLTAAGTDGISITGGTGSVIGSGTSIAQHVADSTHNGYLVNTDWSIFNGKQAAGNYITALTGDGTASGPGSSSLTLATVNSSVGSYGSASSVATFTVNGKGLVTAATPAPIQIAESQVTNLVSDLAGKQATITTGTISQYLKGNLSLGTFSSDVQTTAKNNTSAQAFYVAQDVGNDANDCSILKPCATIQAGINAANAISAYYKQAIVHVSPATSNVAYNENVTLSQQGVNVICDSWLENGRTCFLKGTLTVNLSGVSGGANYQVDLNETYMSGFVFSVSSGDNITFSGTAFQRFTLTNSYVDNNGTGSAVVMSNSGTSGAGTKSTFTGYDVSYNSSNATNPTISLTAGRFWNYGTQTNINNSTSNKALIQTGATSSFICSLCTINGQVQVTSNTANASMNLSTIAAGSQSCVDTPSSASTGTIILANVGCTSTNTNSITGSGVVVSAAGNALLSSSGDIASTVTQAVFQTLPQGEILLGAGAVKGTNVLLSIKGGHIKVTQTTPPTATVNANAGTGATCTLANASDSAGTMTITTGSVGTPTTGDQCRINFNKAYSVAPICVFSAANATAGSNLVGHYRGTRSTTVNNIAFNTAGATSGTYVYDYKCEESQ